MMSSGIYAGDAPDADGRADVEWSTQPLRPFGGAKQTGGCPPAVRQDVKLAGSC
jgi:hypothetical protein